VAGNLTRQRRLRAAPLAIEVRDLHKTFQIPDQRVDTLKERLARPLHKIDYRELKALRAINFDVHQGEFFGIVGRNGSGKSTLLKVLASIYRESRRRLDSVLEFAELTEFVDLKLKNYSSGMMVRLAFSVMVGADADVMLIDEVLAVGDAAFAQKCTDVFRQKRSDGKTLVLVTHDMASVQAFCDRAMLIHDGEQRYLGDPEEAALRYYRLNFAGHSDDGVAAQSIPDINVSLIDVWLEDASGQRVDNVEQGQTFRYMLAKARQQMDAPVFNFHCLNVDGHWVFAFSTALEETDGTPQRIAAGEQIRIVADIDNPLTRGRYSLECWISRSREPGTTAIHILRLLDFFVFGTKAGAGSIALDGEVQTTIESAGLA
jgi:ABC-type polysaccharide/polyol phosphate transport system ATPase subunit